jgi:hypothetical protein
MNRRSILTLLVGAMVIPCELVSDAMAKGSPKSSCEDCKKCDPTCNCNCKKKCKCKPGCCKAERPSPPRGFDGRTPDFQPPHSKPARGFDGRTPNFGPPSRSRSPQDRPPQGRPPQSRPSSDRHSRYKEMMKKFDKNNDGKIDEKEKEAIREYMKQRMNRSSR